VKGEEEKSTLVCRQPQLIDSGRLTSAGERRERSVPGLKMQTNIRLFEYSNTKYYSNSKFDIGVFVCFN